MKYILIFFPFLFSSLLFLFICIHWNFTLLSFFLSFFFFCLLYFYLYTISKMTISIALNDNARITVKSWLFIHFFRLLVVGLLVEFFIEFWAFCQKALLQAAQCTCNCSRLGTDSKGSCEYVVISTSSSANTISKISLTRNQSRRSMPQPKRGMAKRLTPCWR